MTRRTLFLTEISVRQDNGSHESPRVEGDTNPRRDDFDPHRAVVLSKSPRLCIRFIPIGQGHHHVKRSQSKHEVEERPGVCNFFLFIIVDIPLRITIPLKRFSFTYQIKVAEDKEEYYSLETINARKNLNQEFMKTQEQKLEEF